jgi:hypothetical protein
LHRDNILAKVPGPARMLRRVTQTPFIAGPLAQILSIVTISQRTLLKNNSADFEIPFFIGTRPTHNIDL